MPCAISTQPGRLLLILLLCLLVLGCGGNNANVSRENYDKIKSGMTVEDVEQILGKGTRLEDGNTMGGAMYEWTNGKKKITVTFQKGKVERRTSAGL